MTKTYDCIEIAGFWTDIENSGFPQTKICSYVVLNCSEYDIDKLENCEFNTFGDGKNESPIFYYSNCKTRGSFMKKHGLKAWENYLALRKKYKRRKKSRCTLSILTENHMEWVCKFINPQEYKFSVKKGVQLAKSYEKYNIIQYKLNKGK